MTGPLLVTGGTGLLGSAIREVYPHARFLSRADGDLRDIGAAHRIFSEIRPAKVLHLAARVGGVKDNAAHNSRFFEENALINTAVLAAARQARVPTVISLLSSCAFPLFKERPTTESDLQTALPYDGNAGYGYAKRMLDLHTRLAAAEEGMRWSTMTPVTMYGPNDSFDPERGHVVGSLIRRCWEAKTQGTPYTVWGSGRAVRQFLFVRDAARLVLDGLDRSLGPETTIVAPDEGITIKTLAESIAQAMNYTGPIVFDRNQPEGVLVKRLHSTKFSSQFPGFQFTPLQEGLTETVRWFMSHRAQMEGERHGEPSLCRQS